MLSPGWVGKAKLQRRAAPIEVPYSKLIDVCITARNMQRFRGGLAFKAHRLSYHSTLGFRVIEKKKKKKRLDAHRPGVEVRVNI